VRWEDDGVARFNVKRFARSMADPGSDEVQRVAEPSPVWSSWAASKGFTYEFDGSAYGEGRSFDPVADERRGGEHCHDVVTGAWNGFAFTFFARTLWHVSGRAHKPDVAGALIIELPGRPVDALLAMTPAEAFAAAGGELPRTGEFTWREPRELFGHGRWLEPTIVEGILQKITVQLEAAPAELWQR
jgi:hypothetical protein